MLLLYSFQGLSWFMGAEILPTLLVCFAQQVWVGEHHILHMVLHIIVWYCMILYGLSWQTPHSSLLPPLIFYYMVLHFIIWYCMVSYGIACYCKVLNGIVRSELAPTTFFTSYSPNPSLLLHWAWWGQTQLRQLFSKDSLLCWRGWFIIIVLVGITNEESGRRKTFFRPD